MATHKEILSKTTERLIAGDVASPQKTVQGYGVDLKSAVDTLLVGAGMRQASLITEAIYAAYQLGAVRKTGAPLIAVFDAEKAARERDGN